MKQTKLLLLVIALGFSLMSSAQTYLGIHQSNYAGVQGTDLQPASFVDGRFKVDVNLFSLNLNFYQNAYAFNTDVMPKWWVKSFMPDDQPMDFYYDKDEDGNIDTISSSYYNGGSNPFNDWLHFNRDSLLVNKYSDRLYDENSTRKLGLYNNIQIDILNFAFHINPKIAVGVAAKFRSITNIDNVDPKLAILSQYELDYNKLWNAKFDEELLNMNHMSWMEYGILYSQVLSDKNEHFFKFGAKPKWLSGYSSAYIHTDNFSYNLFNDDTSQYLSGDFSYGHSDGALSGQFIDENGKFQLPKSASKFGLGLDLGFVYEWRPKWKEYKYDMDGETNLWRRDQNKYDIRVGASILDIGGMKFAKGNLSRDFTVNSNSLFDLTVFTNDKGLEEMDQTLDSLITNNPDWVNKEESSTYFMSLPTAASLQVDYHIWKWFYLNATGMISIQSKKLPHRVRVPNQFSITPSFDHAWVGVHVPVSYNTYSGFKAGIGTRLGPLTVGVTNFKTLFATGKIRGAEFYMGLRVPILYTHPEDMDGDKVSDKVDNCKEIPGVWAFKGCPDTDGDGIQDIDDLCPNTPGLEQFQGCPDTDSDGIPDKDDECPEVAGLREFKGCPDNDADGIPDIKDDCPEEPGKMEFNGCPDSDDDGIKDSDDACPNAAGPVENNGCPDTDNDGLFDFIDDCPTVAGPKENNGCPWPDTDGDGLLDKDDKCPYLAGPIKNDGCPYQDTDEDGVLDKDDKCPNTPGPVENDGCPVIEQEVQEILNTAFENLEFETGKDVIKQESIPSLSELAEVLTKKPEWKLQIAGHTDNVGNDQANLILSKKRAEAVKNFMISKGIEAERLSVLYFGETMPIASNDTPEGRQKNRRVEMTIVFN